MCLWKKCINCKCSRLDFCLRHVSLQSPVSPVPGRRFNVWGVRVRSVSPECPFVMQHIGVGSSALRKKQVCPLLFFLLGFYHFCNTTCPCHFSLEVFHIAALCNFGTLRTRIGYPGHSQQFEHLLCKINYWHGQLWIEVGKRICYFKKPENPEVQ